MVTLVSKKKIITLLLIARIMWLLLIALTYWQLCITIISDAVNYRVLLGRPDHLVREEKTEKGDHQVPLVIPEPVDLPVTKEARGWLELKDDRDKKDHR